MKFSGTLSGLLLAAIIAILSIGATESAQAQPYTVCNNSPVPVTVTLIVGCGGAVMNLPPANVLIPPAGCFTWNVPATCVVLRVRVNGVFYPVPAAVPFCYAVFAPPPNQVCFTGAIPQVQIL